ncbi:MAG: carboxypeptidase M32 [Thermoprotei archaeon]
MYEVFQNSYARQLAEKYKPIWALQKSMALLEWDLETYMPKLGAEERGFVNGQLELIVQEKITDPEFLSLLDKLERSDNLNDYEKGLARVLRRDVKLYTKLPSAFIQELSSTTNRASLSWREAKRTNDFSKFKPDLEKIVDLMKRMAEYLGYEEHPYNALLDLHEEGITVADLDHVFSVIAPSLRKTLDRIIEEGYFTKTSKLQEERYTDEEMRKAEWEILRHLGYDEDRFRVDISPHPFTTSIGLNDVRITTRRKGYDFKDTLFSILHEGGHALYELQIDPALTYTPLARGASSGFHESQSRFMENVIGRTREFVEGALPLLSQYLDFLKKYDPEEVFVYFAHVSPSPIRVEADEVTYNFHILLRYELEKGLMINEVKVDDLPELWNEKIEKYLGIRPKSYAEGVLQDIHWSGGLGGFPAYTIGNVIAAQIRHRMTEDVKDLEDKVARLELDEVKVWLREKVHRWGATYSPKELLNKSFGEDLNPSYLTSYLDQKYR